VGNVLGHGELHGEKGEEGEGEKAAHGKGSCG